MNPIGSLMNFRGWDLFVILLIVVLLFGAKKLPGLARSAREALTELRRGYAEDRSPPKNESDDDSAAKKQEKDTTVR